MAHFSIAGRITLTTAVQNGSDWDVVFDFADLRGAWTAEQIAVNDLVYIFAQDYDTKMQTVRYKILSIASVAGPTVTCTIRYDDDHESEPDLTFLTGLKHVLCSPTEGGLGLTVPPASQDLGYDAIAFDIINLNALHLGEHGGGGGAVSSVAGRTGDVVLTKSDVGLTNVDNTSDLDKPVSTATQTSLNLKANLTDIYNAAVPWTPNHTLADGTRYLAGDLVWYNGNIYKANFDNESMPVTNELYWQNLGPGYRLNIDGRDIPNIPGGGGSGGYQYSITADGTSDGANLRLVRSDNYIDNVKFAAGPNITIESTDADTITISSSGGGDVSSVAGRTGDVVLTKSDVGLGNVDNTGDLDKPISTAAQTALDGKADKSRIQYLNSAPNITLNVGEYDTFVIEVSESMTVAYSNFAVGKSINIYLVARHEDYLPHTFPTNTIFAELGKDNIMYSFAEYTTRILLQNIGDFVVNFSSISLTPPIPPNYGSGSYYGYYGYYGNGTDDGGIGIDLLDFYLNNLNF